MFQKNQRCFEIFRSWRQVSFVQQCRMVVCFSVCLLLLFLALPCAAQSTTGDIIASVMDPSSAMVPDASLVLIQLETGQQTVLKTDANGLAVFSSLRPGNYKLVASRDGFRKAELNGITVVIGQRTNLEVHMQVGDNTESVTVSASQAAMLNSESAAVGQVINQNSIQTLPLNGRNFVQLTQLTTGAAPIGNGNSPATTWTGRSDTTISIAGLRESDTSFLVNGIETRNSRFGNTGIRPSVDAIQEFRVQRTTFGAEFGHAASIVNTELLAGANPFHLVLFALNRNRAYAANTYFAKQGGLSQPALNQNNFGATFSGPVWIPKLYNGRNRTFFMFNFEGFRLTQGQTLTGLYPSVAQLQGNLADDSVGTGLFPTSSAFCVANPGSGKCVNIVNPQTGQPFAGNVIPSNQLDGTAMKALQFIPKANITAGGGVAFPSYNTVASPRNTQTINQYNARLDHRFSDRDSLYATWSNSNDNLFNASINPLGGNAVPLNDHLWTAAHVHSFRPTLVNEFRFGVNDSATFRNSEGAYGPNYAGVLFGLPYANNDNPATYGVPVFGISGFGSVGSIAEVIGADDKYYQVSDNLTWTHGKLTSMNGLQYIHENFTQITDFASNPTLSYSNGYSTRNAAGQRVSSIGLSDFLLGLPYEVTAASGDSTQYLHSSYYGFYSQNNWKVLPSLTVNLGLRYEYAGSPIESRNRSQFFDTATGQFAYAGSSIRRSIVKPDFNNFAPRIGFAWRPSFLPNTVIRGGVGTYYATDNFNEEQFKNQGSPFYTSRSNTPSTTTPVSIFNPFAGTSTTFPPAHANIFTLDQDNRTPYINQWGLDIQQAFASDYLLELEYAGSSGQKLAQRKNANIGAIDTTGTVPLASRKPFPQYGFILVSSNYGRSNYNALTGKLEKRMSHGNSFLVAYTYSKAIDIGITDDFSSLSRDFFRYDRGVSDYHVPHRLVASYTYQLPFGRGQRLFSNAPLGVEYLIGGWQLNGITTFSSGQYNTPTLAGDNLNIGDFSQSRPDVVGNVGAGRHAPTQWFNAAAFSKPGYGTPGNAGRNSLEQPGYQNWDASLFKALPLGERANFQLRMEAFNVFNHTQFGHASTSLGPGFGAITSTRPARIVQIGGRLVF